MRRKPFCLTLVRALLIAGLTLSICAPVWAAGREKAHFEFQANPAKYPVGNLVFDSQGNLYGATTGPPSTVFRFAPKPGGGWSYSQLYVFDNPAKGSQVEGGLVVDGAGNLYGTTAGGGANNSDGVVFELIPNSNGQWTETVLCDFDAYPGDAAIPFASLIFDGRGNLYGTASAGGTYGFGAVFELTPSSGGGWTESVLYSFVGPPNDGAIPLANLVFDVAGDLYGTTQTGGPGGCQVEGTSGCGTVFQLSPPSAPGGAWTETVLHSFLGGDDGGFPLSAVTLDAVGNLYGTTEEGGGLCGNIGCGTVFEVSPELGAWTESVIHRFSSSSNDGRGPEGSLTLDSRGNLYGTTFQGGVAGVGTVFHLKHTSSGSWREDGSYSFTGGSDGCNPPAGVILDAGGNLYGTTRYGGDEFGANGFGVVFVGRP
jgi:uncharacterized repeat protein (TIGR03803 family)